MAIDYLKENLGLYRAAEDLSDWQWKAVQLNSLNDEVMWQKPTFSGNGVPVGILRNAPGAGGECIVQVNGICRVYLGGTQPIQASRIVGVTPDGTVVEGGAFGVTVSKGIPGDLIEVLLGGSLGIDVGDNFDHDDISAGDSVTVPKGQQMNVHGLKLNIKGKLILNGTLYIRE